MSSQSKDGLLAVCGSLIGLSTISTVLRFHARKKSNSPVMADDILAVVSLVSFISAAIVSIMMVHYHMLGYALSPAIASELSAKLQIAWDVLGTTSLACSKLSALFFYKRIFTVGGKVWFQRAITGSIVVVAIWLVVFQFLTGFQCGTHFSALWNGTYTQYCTLSFPYLLGFAISDFLLDIWIVALPVPRILRLKTTLPKKLGVLGVFLLTFICVFASGARMYSYIESERVGPAYFIDHDEERVMTLIFFYTMLETGLAIIAVTLPSLWFLVASISPDKILKSISSTLSFHTRRSTGSKATSTEEARLKNEAGVNVSSSVEEV